MVGVVARALWVLFVLVMVHIVARWAWRFSFRDSHNCGYYYQDRRACRVSENLWFYHRPGLGELVLDYIVAAIIVGLAVLVLWGLYVLAKATWRWVFSRPPRIANYCTTPGCPCVNHAIERQRQQDIDDGVRIGLLAGLAGMIAGGYSSNN